MTPLSLYGNLYQYRHAGDVLVLDDIDSVFSKIEGINLLKAAMDTKPVRRINWESTSSTVVNLGLPSGFDFKGSVVLISNIGFNKNATHTVSDSSFANLPYDEFEFPIKHPIEKFPNSIADAFTLKNILPPLSTIILSIMKQWLKNSLKIFLIQKKY